MKESDNVRMREETDATNSYMPKTRARSETGEVVVIASRMDKDMEGVVARDAKSLAFFATE